MYDIGHFKSEEKKDLLAFMRAHSFATVIGTTEQNPVATHLPLDIVEENNELIFSGHLMRNTNHYLTFEKNKQVLIIFQSEPAYIHSSWYENPAQASTVNYMAVHASGEMVFGNEAETLAAIKKITDVHLGDAGPGSFNTIPEAYITQHVKAIASFTIKVTTLQHVFKLSQNKSLQDRANIIAALENRGGTGDQFIAAQMKKII
jgi:transcriptional regulator